ncbi:hypothetical protein [Lysobacter silvisoli]|nr:hypothetical protein [Lysobacter silvisoli]
MSAFFTLTGAWLLAWGALLSRLALERRPCTAALSLLDSPEPPR